MRKTVIVSALALFAAVGAHAENNYHQDDGVLNFQGQLSRAEVQAQTLEAARSGQLVVAGDQPFSSVRKGVPLVSQRDRASVRTEAVAAARDPHFNMEPGAFADSVLPAAHTGARASAAIAQADDGIIRR